MIFIDSNIPMYLVGNHDGQRQAAQRLLERAAVMEAAGIEEIMTFDTGFDAVPIVRRTI